MKKPIFLLLPAAIIAVILYSFSIDAVHYPGGAPAGYTGSPGDGKNCTQCHGGNPANVIGWITSDIDSSGYVAGQTYTITVTVSGSGKKGFEVSPQNASGALLGSLAAGSGTELAGNGKYVTQSSSSTANPKVWSFEWTAPGAGTGEVTFYGAFVISEPVTKLGTLSVQENTGVSISENPEFPGRVYPNPASGILKLDLYTGIAQSIKISILDLQGREVRSMSGVTPGQAAQTLAINLDGISEGVYIVSLQDGRKSYTQKIIVGR
jgi:hypothetical protein